MKLIFIELLNLGITKTIYSFRFLSLGISGPSSDALKSPIKNSSMDDVDDDDEANGGDGDDDNEVDDNDVDEAALRTTTIIGPSKNFTTLHETTIKVDGINPFLLF